MKSINWSKIRRAKLERLTRAVDPPDFELPIFPKAITEFRQQAAKPTVSVKSLGQIVESDAGLTCELLRTVNSAATGLRCKVSSVSQAINLLGIRQTELLLTISAVRSTMSLKKSKLINPQLFWNTNFERALFAKDLASTINADQELAFAGTMLQDFLLPLLTSELGESYVKYADRAKQESINLPRFEQKTWNWDHSEAAGQIMTTWCFPDDLVCCVLYHHAGLEILLDPLLSRTAVAAVAIAGLLPDFFQQVPDGFDHLMKLDAAWPQFRLVERLERVEQQFQEAQLVGSARHVSFFKRFTMNRRELFID